MQAFSLLFRQCSAILSSEVSHMLIKLLLSSEFGLFFGAALHYLFKTMGIDIGLPMTMFGMAGFGNLSCCFFVIYKKWMDKRYAQIEAQIPYPIFHKTNGNFDLGGGKIKNGNLYFCDAGIVCVSMEEKPYTLDEILVQDIHKISFDTIHLHIHTHDGKLFKITLPDAADVVELLKEKDWVG